MQTRRPRVARLDWLLQLRESRCRADRVIDASAASLYAARIALAHTSPTRILLIQECNHMPMLERTAATANALMEFLQ